MRWDTGRSERIRYLMVEFPKASNGWAQGLVSGEYGMFVGGSIDLSDESDLGASGTLDYVGADRPDASGMVRVVYDASDGAGGSASCVLGTFVMALDDPEASAGKASGSVQLLSALHVAASKLFPRPYVIGRGCNCVERAAELMGSLHLGVSAAYSTRLLRRDIVMEAGQSYLDAANALLAAAGFLPCRPDPYGGLVMRPPSGSSEAAWTFASGDRSVLVPEVTEHDGLAGAPNAVHLTWDEDGFSCWASAVNDDPSSPSSTVSVGYESGVCEDADNPEGATAAEVLESVKAQAVQRLTSACSGYSTVTIAHPWVPLSVGERADVEYPEAGVSFSGKVFSQTVSWDEKCRVSVETVVGRSVSATFSPSVRGGVL